MKPNILAFFSLFSKVLHYTITLQTCQDHIAEISCYLCFDDMMIFSQVTIIFISTFLKKLAKMRRVWILTTFLHDTCLLLIAVLVLHIHYLNHFTIGSTTYIKLVLWVAGRNMHICMLTMSSTQDDSFHRSYRMKHFQRYILKPGLGLQVD